MSKAKPGDFVLVEKTGRVGWVAKLPDAPGKVKVIFGWDSAFMERKALRVLDTRVLHAVTSRVAGEDASELPYRLVIPAETIEAATGTFERLATAKTEQIVELWQVTVPQFPRKATVEDDADRAWLWERFQSRLTGTLIRSSLDQTEAA